MSGHLYAENVSSAARESDKSKIPYLFDNLSLSFIVFKYFAF